MPIQIIMTDRLMNQESARHLHKEICQSLLAAHDISDNRFMLPNVVGEVVFVDPAQTFAGLENSALAIVELKLPAFTFATQDQRDQFVHQVTELVLKYTDGKLPREKIWVNAVYAVDGFWGIAGKAYTNEQLQTSIQQAS